MRAGAETKGRIAIALAIGFCVTAMSAQRTQQARPSSESRKRPRPSFRSRTTAPRPRPRAARGAARAARRPCNPLARQARTSRRHHGSPAYLAPDNSASHDGPCARPRAPRTSARWRSPRPAEGAVREARSRQRDGATRHGTLGTLRSRSLQPNARPPSDRGRRIVQSCGDVPSQDPREALSSGPGCPAHWRRERARIAGASGGGIATLDDETIKQLRTVARTIDPRRADQQRNALARL